MVVMKSSEGGIEGIERIFRENTLVRDITEVEERAQRLDDLHMSTTFKRVHKDLGGIRYDKFGVQGQGDYYLHKGLGVIAGPLLEVAALLEPSETRKEGCKCDTVEN